MVKELPSILKQHVKASSYPFHFYKQTTFLARAAGAPFVSATEPTKGEEKKGRPSGEFLTGSLEASQKRWIDVDR